MCVFKYYCKTSQGWRLSITLHLWVLCNYSNHHTYKQETTSSLSSIKDMSVTVYITKMHQLSVVPSTEVLASLQEIQNLQECKYLKRNKMTKRESVWWCHQAWICAPGMEKLLESWTQNICIAIMLQASFATLCWHC